jgi:HlyD family secretion protein
MGMTPAHRRWALAIAVVGAVALTFFLCRRAPEPRYTTATVDRGDVVETVGATGALQAVVTVQVGSQVSGTIQELKADFNSVVKKGQVIARLDPSSFEARVLQARANVVTAQANVEKAKAAIDDAKQKYERAKQLAGEQLLPAADLETAQATYQGAVAGLEGAKAAVTQAQANLTQSQVDLAHTVITAPIDGVVISRSVDVGQTVAASFQAPVLFTIANDLTQMQVNASVDESDVGKLAPDQEVTFHVDAYPDRTFTGRVQQVRLQPTTTQNVVTYNTIITVENKDLRLMPGMTASVSVIVERRSNVLRVPAAALRFRPPDAAAANAAGERAGAGRDRAAQNGGPASAAEAGSPDRASRRGSEAGGAGREGGEGRGRWRDRMRAGGGSSGAGTAGPEENPARPAQVYQLVETGVEPTRILVGPSDGHFVEVREGLTEGATVVTGLEGATASGARGTPASGSGSNPFNPQFQRRQR